MPALKISFKIRITLFVFAVLNLVVAFLLNGDMLFAWLLGYFLGMLAVFIHLGSSYFTEQQEDQKFIQTYYISLFIRFLIVCTLYVAMIMMLKIDEFSFTVSFIISYLFHSVIEVIFLNQKLSN